MLNNIYTLKEAAKLWGLSSPDLLRQKIARGCFTSDEVRKSADVWLITRNAMIREYGEPLDFKLGQEVIYQDQKATIFDYNLRHQEYTLTLNGSHVYGVKTSELSPV